MRALLFAITGVTVLLAPILPTHVYAQGNDNKVGMDEIVVTARKREETLLEAPVAITVMDATRLEAISSTVTLRDVTSRLPNVTTNFNASDSNTPSIRGIGTGTRNIGFDSGYGVFIDGAFAGRNGVSNRILPDVERIEFLPGPQATIFGKNTTVGVMNVVTRKPGNEWEGSLSGLYGRFGQSELRGSVRGPLSDTIGIGFTLASMEDEGYITQINSSGNFPADEYGLKGPVNSRLGGAFQLSAQTDSFDVHFLADFIDIDLRNQWVGTVLVGEPALPAPGLDLSDTDQKDTTDSKEWGATLLAEWGIGDGTMNFISTYRDYTTDGGFDDDGTPLNVQHDDFWGERQKHFSSELRYTGSAGDSFEYIAGLYYQSQNLREFRDVYVLGIFPLHTDPIDILGRLENDAWAVFANGEYSFTDRTALELGIRYTKENKSITEYEQNGQGLVVDRTLDEILLDPITQLDPDATFSDVSYTVALSHAFADNINVHARYSRGFKSGGYYIDWITTPYVPPMQFGDEFVDNFEIGLKATLLDDRLFANFAVFLSDYQDQQVSVLRFDPGTALPIIQVRNASDSRTQGAELTLTYSGDQFDWSAAFGHMNGKITRLDDVDPETGLPVDRSGEGLNPPAYTANLFGQYTIPVGDNSIDLMADWIWRDRAGPTDRPERQSDITNVTNIRVRYNIGENLSFSLWSENVFDNRFVTGRGGNAATGFLEMLGYNAGDWIMGSYMRPRTYGVDFRYTF